METGLTDDKIGIPMIANSPAPSPEIEKAVATQIAHMDVLTFVLCGFAAFVMYGLYKIVGWVGTQLSERGDKFSNQIQQIIDGETATRAAFIASMAKMDAKQANADATLIRIENKIDNKECKGARIDG